MHVTRAQALEPSGRRPFTLGRDVPVAGADDRAVEDVDPEERDHADRADVREEGPRIGDHLGDVRMKLRREADAHADERRVECAEDHAGESSSVQPHRLEQPTVEEAERTTDGEMHREAEQESGRTWLQPRQRSEDQLDVDGDADQAQYGRSRADGEGPDEAANDRSFGSHG